MRSAYALLGLMFLCLFVAGAYVLEKKASESSGYAAPDTVIHIIQSTSTMALSLTSPAFQYGETIPITYTCDGDNIMPPLEISGIPDGTQSLVLIMEDPDVPKRIREDGMWDHLVVFNIPASISQVAEGETVEGIYGANTRGKMSYQGPCPPAPLPGEPVAHRYMFKLYALDSDLPLEEGATKDQVMNAMTEHEIEHVTLMGLYGRTR